MSNTSNCISVDKEAPEDGEDGEVSAGKTSNKGGAAAESGGDRDERSVFVKNVDYSADEASLREHFDCCGKISSVHIRKNFQTQQPLG